MCRSSYVKPGINLINIPESIATSIGCRCMTPVLSSSLCNKDNILLSHREPFYNVMTAPRMDSHSLLLAIRRMIFRAEQPSHVSNVR